MNERMLCIDLYAGEEGVTLGNGSAYTTVPFDFTIVGVTVHPSVDDAGLTVDLADDGTDIITAIAAATKGTPGTWLSTHLGGANAPVIVADGSVIRMDVNTAAADTVVHTKIFGLVSEVS